jgi:large subunit ribosomal protein L17
MRHQVFGKQLGRSTGQRTALRRTLITQLFEHERITTTLAKAQAIRSAAEHMITQAKRGLASGDASRVVYLRRLINGRLDSKEIGKKVFDELAPRYAERPGGYTRIIKLGPRKGDAAEMVILELVDSEKSAKKPDISAQAGTVGGLSLGDRARSALGRLGGNRSNTAATPATEE